MTTPPTDALTVTFARAMEQLPDADRFILLEQLRREAFRTAERIYCYAIQAGPDGPIKIGVARKPAERLKTLQTGNASELRGLAAWRVLPYEEAAIHKAFADLRLRGEWFKPAPELIDFVLLRGADWCDW